METTLKKQVPIDMNGQDAVGAGIEIVAKVVVVGTITTMEVWRRTHLEEYVKMCNKFASQLPQHTED
ncbi:unnamed protein product [Sphagnum jensenii]|uniref:Uncharacterized protein n=1 Tax=Sphagnum jensenii TaxID=128206 RepID=A0ABP0XDH0_9BRYO